MSRRREIPVDKSRILLSGYGDPKPWVMPAIVGALMILAGIVAVVARSCS